MTIFFVLLAVIVLAGVVCLLDALCNRNKKSEYKRPYAMGSANVIPGAYRKSKNW